jgi:hypothetical protein
MALYKVPKNLGKVRVAMGLGGRFTVWNGKQGPGEFVILCRDRKQADEVCRKLNAKEHKGEISVPIL